MAKETNRYNKMQQYMTYVLLADLLLFALYLISAGCAVIWAKALTAILAIILSVLCLSYLFLTKELFRRRSRWMTAAAGAILICLLFSLLLRFPSPKPQRSVIPDISGISTSEFE